MPGAAPASPDQAALLRELLDRRLLIETGVPGVYGRGGDFEDVRERVAALVTRAAAGEAPEQLRFPPILPRRDLETRRLPEVLPPPRRQHLRLRGHRGAGRRAVRARQPPRGLERVPGDDRPRAHARGLLPGLSRRSPRAAGSRPAA